MTIRPVNLHLVLFLACFAAMALALVSCGDDANEGEAIPCRPGEVRDASGACVPAGGGRETGTSGATGPSETGELPSSSSTASVGSTESQTGACEPGETRCADPATLSTCNAEGSGFTETEDCGDNRRCRDATDVAPALCVIGAVVRCEPGEFVQCAGATRQEICSDRGFAEGVEADCPAEAPNCLVGEGCTDAICNPGVRSCDGDSVVECSADGGSQDTVRICPSGCAQGQCIDPCTDPDKGGFVGCDFWAVHLDNSADAGQACNASTPCRALDQTCVSGTCVYQNVSTNRFGLTISNVEDSPVEVTVSDAAGNVLSSLTIPASGLEVIGIPIPPGSRRGSRIDPEQAFRIESSSLVTVHQFNPPNNVGAFSNDASLLLPTNAVGTDYLVVGWPAVFADNSAYVSILAVEEGDTTLTVTAPIDMEGADGVEPALAGVETTYTISQGEVLTLASPGGTIAAPVDLSGLEFTSDQPVAAFVGNECTNVPADTRFCDHMEQQLYPTNTWGSEYVLAKFRERGSEPDYYRIMALEDGTRLETQPIIAEVNGQVLQRGEFVEFAYSGDAQVVGVSDDDGAARRISVAQFMVGAAYGCRTCTTASQCSGPTPQCLNGLCYDVRTTSQFCINNSDCQSNICDFLSCLDVSLVDCAIPSGTLCSIGAVGDPAMLLNVSNEQFLSEYVFFVPEQYQQNFITIVSREGAEIEVDGQGVFESGAEIPGTDFRIIRRPITEGVHRLRASQPVGLYVYGYDCDVSYAYPGGLNIESIRLPGE